MDAFGDDFTAAADVDPAAEFLAREHDQLAGLEDLIPEVSQPQPAESSSQGGSPTSHKLLYLEQLIV